MSAKEVGSRLGRGLAALIGETSGGETMASKPGPNLIPVELLEPGPFQPRTTIDPDQLSALADSIRSSGLLQPLLARPHPSAAGRYQIIAGERRWRASQLAGLHEVPVLLRSLADGEAMAAALVENLQRQDLDAIEEAEGYQRLVREFGKTQEALAEAVGKSRSHVANTMRLLNLSGYVQAAVRSGKLSAGHARSLLGHPEEERLARDIIDKGLNVRQAEALARRIPPKNPPEQSHQAPTEANETAALAQQLTDQLGLRVSIQFKGGPGHMRIDFQSLEQLDSLIQTITNSSS